MSSILNLTSKCYNVCLKANSAFQRPLVVVNSYVIITAKKNYCAITPRRAILYVPGHDKRKIEKIPKLNVDCVVLDCEDGVAINMKTEARKKICEFASSLDFGRSEFGVRINSIDSGLAEEDISDFLSMGRLPEALLIPKVETLDHVQWIDNYHRQLLSARKLDKKINVIMYVESSIGLLNLREICRKAVELSNTGPYLISGLVFGSDDFCADIGATRSSDAKELLTARQTIVIIAKSFHLQVIDMVHINYNDTASLEKFSKEGADMGFTGKQIIHPSQIQIVQEAFSPSKEKIEWATELIELFNSHQKSGKGAFIFRGAVIDKPLLLQAQYIVNMANILKLK